MIDIKQLKLLALSTLAVFTPIKPALVAVLVLICVDLVLGILAARKRGEPITSLGFKKTIGKLFVYELAIMLAFISQQYLTGDILPIEKIVAAFIGLTELTSVMENLNEVSGGTLLKALVEKISHSADSTLNQ